MSARTLRIGAAAAMTGLVLVACSHSEFAVRPIPRIAAENVGKPVSRLQDAFGAPRKIDTTPTKLVYVWFLEQKPAGAPMGFHGCELEVTVDARSEHILGYSLSNIGWAKCSEIERKIHVADR
ncbi:MAG: hypothetical protein JWN43_4599 [Gammaproteobacteria bacterium]|nr:hypothetical protein [Gammaproteobacteria bacterium]